MTLSQTQEEEETAVLHAAAVTIQSHMRTHLRTKASPTTPDAATATTNATSTATKKSATSPVAGGSSAQQGGPHSPSSPGKDTKSSTATLAAGGASTAVDGGVAATGAGGGASEDETGISRATRQMQVYTTLGLREIVELLWAVSSAVRPVVVLRM